MSIKYNKRANSKSFVGRSSSARPGKVQKFFWKRFTVYLDVQMEKESISNKPWSPNYKNREVQYL